MPSWKIQISGTQLRCSSKVTFRGGLHAFQQWHLSDFLFYFSLLKKWEMNPFETYFQVFTLSSHICQVDTNHEVVAPFALTWLTFTWTSGATSIWSVPPQFLVTKMSHATLIGVTLVWVAPPLLTWLIFGQNHPVWFPYYLPFF
jgi:hypothetical protein